MRPPGKFWTYICGLDVLRRKLNSMKKQCDVIDIMIALLSFCRMACPLLFKF